jgi:hypothetical protein
MTMAGADQRSFAKTSNAHPVIMEAAGSVNVGAAMLSQGNPAQAITFGGYLGNGLKFYSWIARPPGYVWVNRLAQPDNPAVGYGLWKRRARFTIIIHVSLAPQFSLTAQ